MTPSPLELLLTGRYNELLAQMRSPGVRSRLMAEVAGRLDSAGAQSAPSSEFAERMLELRSSGDYSWGLLSPQDRRRLLTREARLLRGGGSADGGAAQRTAVRRLRSQLAELYETLDVALRDGDVEWLTPLAEHLGDLLEISGDFGVMRERYEQLLVAAQRLESPSLELHAQLGLALAHSRLGAHVPAADAAQAAAELASVQPALHAAALHLQGTALAMQGQFDLAETLLTSAIERREQLADKLGVAASASNLAFVLAYTGRAAEARSRLEAALTVCQAGGDLRGEGQLLQNLATLAYNSGDYAQARELHQRGLAIQRELGDPRNEAGCLSGLAFAAYAEHDYPAAREWLSQALAIAARIEDSYTQQVGQILLGNVELLLENAEAARNAYGAALDLARSGGDRPGEARAQYGLGLATEDRPQAAWQIAAGLRICLETGEQSALCDGLLYAAVLLQRAGSPKASELASGAYYLAGQINHAFDALDLYIREAAGLAASYPSTPQSDLLELCERAITLLEALAAQR